MPCLGRMVQNAKLPFLVYTNSSDCSELQTADTERKQAGFHMLLLTTREQGRPINGLFTVPAQSHCSLSRCESWMRVCMRVRVCTYVFACMCVHVRVQARASLRRLSHPHAHIRREAIRDISMTCC